MKQERIEELLAGTEYADKTTTHHEEVNYKSRCIMTWDEMAGDKAIMRDRFINAARVQLLAKALREVETHHVRQNAIKGRDEARSKTLDIVRAALKEAMEG